MINETLKEIIRGEAISILSAKNAFENIFNRITSKLGMGGLNEHLMSPDNVWNIMSGFTRKFMGDFAQELNAIADKFGNNSGGKTQKSLLADGDRPSFIRASLLKLLATSGIKNNSYIWYMSDSGGLILGGPPSLSAKPAAKEAVKKTVKPSKSAPLPTPPTATKPTKISPRAVAAKPPAAPPPAPPAATKPTKISPRAVATKGKKKKGGSRKTKKNKKITKQKRNTRRKNNKKRNNKTKRKNNIKNRKLKKKRKTRKNKN